MRDWRASCIMLMMDPTIETILIPDAWLTTASRTATGSVVIKQAGDTGDSVIIIPPAYVKAFVQGVFDVSRQRGALGFAD